MAKMVIKMISETEAQVGANDKSIIPKENRKKR